LGALSYATRGGEHRLLGLILANLAELDDDWQAWEEGIRILEQGGNHVLAERFRRDAGRLASEPGGKP
jgi:hypothetical protein